MDSKFFDPDISRRREAAIAEVKQLLGDDHLDLANRLGDIVMRGDLLVHEREWWQTPQAKAIRRAAAELAEALDALDWLEFQTVEGDFDVTSRDIFAGWVLPAKASVNPDVARQMEEDGDDPHNSECGFLVRFHVQAHRLAKIKTKQVGRPIDNVRRRIARDVAEEMLLAGLAPAKSDTGLFAKVLRVVFRHAQLAPPMHMFKVTADAMKEITARKKRDPAFAAAVARATQSTRTGNDLRKRSPSARSDRSRPASPRRPNPR